MPIGFVHTWWIPFEQCWWQAVLPFKSIRMVLEGPLIHHLEVSKQSFVLIVLPFGKIQTRFCISWPTIQNHLGSHDALYTVISPFKNTIANGFNLYEKGTKSSRVKDWYWSRGNNYVKQSITYHGRTKRILITSSAPTFIWGGSYHHFCICTYLPTNNNMWTYIAHVSTLSGAQGALLPLLIRLINHSWNHLSSLGSIQLNCCHYSAYRANQPTLPSQVPI